MVLVLDGDHQIVGYHLGPDAFTQALETISAL